MYNDPIIEQFNGFWSAASNEVDFQEQSKVLRGLVTYIKTQYNDVSNHAELITGMSDELERYLPLMSVDEFISATKAISYVRRSIRTSSLPDYGAGLSREISDEERDQLRVANDASDRDRAESIGPEDSEPGDFIDDLRAESDDGE